MLHSLVGWDHAVSTLTAAYKLFDTPEAQTFLNDSFSSIVNIMLDQM